MQTSHIDHLVVTAPSLEMGVNYVEAALGVRPQPGGEHLAMSAHNALLRLGERIYLEVIAVNPGMLKPDRPRWFELDNLAAKAAPRLAGWVARTPDIRAAQAVQPESFGNVESTIRGGFNWLITLPADGSLPLAGVAPTLIEWQSKDHPASRLRNQGCSLMGLEGFHEHAENITALLAAIKFQDELLVHAIAAPLKTHLIAQIQTPSGIRILK